MNSINPVAASAAAYKVQPAAPARAQETAAAAGPAAPTRGADRVELSGLQNFMQVLKSNDIRTEKVAEIKAQIEANTYETDDKLNVAIDRLIDDLS